MQQAYDTASIYSQILDRQQSSYSSIIGNNMNVIMRTLTVITIILMVPTGIAGFYGMNVPNGMESWIWGFLFCHRPFGNLVDTHLCVPQAQKTHLTTAHESDN